MPLLAEIRTDEASATDPRRVVRRRLRLEVPAFSSRDSASALVHDLSERGLLIETSAGLRAGEVVSVDLPGTGSVDARVVWSRAGRAGCEFVAPITKAAVSAALLVAPAVAGSPMEGAASQAGSRRTGKGGLFLAGLLFVPLAWLAATGSMATVLIVGSIALVAALALIAWGYWIDDNVHF